MSSIIDFFPLDKPRASQAEVLKAIQVAFEKGYKNVLLEAPVGSGKSAIAVACAKFYGDAHVLTPRKSLQDQYVEDFSKESLVTMKGRSSYPCTYLSDSNPEYDLVVNQIKDKKVIFISPGTTTCAEGPCLTDTGAKKRCTIPTEGGIEEFPCPYHVAVDVAQSKDIIIHNLHSFIFQTYYAGRFQKRSLLVADEAHEIEGILRGFAEKKIVLPIFIKDENAPIPSQYKTLDDWAGYLDQFSNLYSAKAKANAPSPREEYLTILKNLSELSEMIGEKFVVDIKRDSHYKRSYFVFTPEYVGNLVDKYILNYGDKRLLMSGTIYDKNLYCKITGLKIEETCFIKIGSSFPLATRPIYLKQKYLVDTSHKTWDVNFKQLITNIKTVMAAFPDDKGLLHAPSYTAGLTLFNALRDTGRVVKHDKDNFQEKLSDFYLGDTSDVFISPICQQGVDFKGDRSRFQMILRVPYPSTSDALMAKKVKEDFPYYNYQSLITFGQQIGRVNRSETDFGVTILMDERFLKFVTRNKSTLPKWLLDAIIYK